MTGRRADCLTDPRLRFRPSLAIRVSVGREKVTLMGYLMLARWWGNSRICDNIAASSAFLVADERDFGYRNSVLFWGRKGDRPLFRVEY